MTSATNRLANERWKAACLAWLKSQGWAATERYDRQTPYIDGIGPLSLVCTVSAWERLGGVLDRAELYGARRGVRDHAVWRKAHGDDDPDLGFIILDPPAWWRVWRRLEELEQAEMAGADAYERGFDAGVRSARAERPPLQVGI